MTAQQPDRPADHDWLDVADAVGVTPITRAACQPAKPVHPVFRQFINDVTLANVVGNWAHEHAHDIEDVDAPIPFHVVDHGDCEGDDCTEVICCCPGDDRCAGTVVQGCPHLSLLCADCRHECLDCRIDAAHDGGVL